MDGVSVFVEHACDELTKLGHKCHIVTSLKGEDTIKGATVTRLRGISPTFYPEHSLTIASYWDMFWLFLKVRPHVVHMFDASLFLAPVLTTFCWTFSIPCVMSHHTRIDLYSPHMLPDLPEQLAFWIMFVLRRLLSGFAATNLTTCSILGAQLVDYFACRPFRVRVWRNGTDIDLFHPKFRSPKLRRELQTKDLPGRDPTDLPLVLYVGRLAVEKDIFLLPKIVKKLNPPGERPTVRVVVVGRGPAQERLEQELRGTNTLMLGPKFGEELRDIYASCDIFLTTCTTETGPLVLIEAMASGICGIAPAAGGPLNLFEHEREGLFYNPLDADDGARAIRRVLSEFDATNPSAPMRKNARDRVQVYSWRATYVEAEEHYREIVGAF
jgi:phosphatidylinositol alpha 1,6-mannosyltransferase